MKNIRLQAIAADFTNCWTRFMVDGKGEAFIKASSEILSKVEKGEGSYIAQSVLSDFIVPSSFSDSPAGVLNLYEYNGTKVEPNVKVVLGCLTAIRSLQGADNGGASKDSLHSVLAAAGAVGKTLVARTRTPQEEALLTEELRSLFLSLEEDQLLSGDDISSAGTGRRSSNKPVNSFAQRADSGSVEGDLMSAGSNDAVDPRLTAKARAALTFGAFRMFPFLNTLAVGPDAVNGFLAKLTETGNWGSAVHLIQLYPGQVSLASFDALCGALQRVQEWDTLAILLLAVRKLLHEQGSTGTGTGSANIAPSDGSEQEQEHGPFLLELSPIELKQKVLDVVNMCLEVNVQGALTAAKKLVNDYKLVELLAQIEEQDMMLKFQNDISKNKWQMTIQMLENKSVQKRLKFYNLLLQNERYWEAAEAYRALYLSGTGAVLATRAQLDAQTLRHRTEYLAMAPALLDSVLVVNDHHSLQRAARELGLSLADFPAPTAATPAAESSPFPSFSSTPSMPHSAPHSPAHSPVVAGKAYGESLSKEQPSASSVAQETAVRSVPFPTLLEQLRSDEHLSAATDGGHQKKKHQQQRGQYFFNGRYRQVVGLDGEWRAMMRRDLSKFGCSILQIASPNRVYILDFRSLCPDAELQPRYSPRSSSAASSPRTPGSPAPANHVSPGMLRDQTRNFLHSLMSDPQVLKVGWDFLSEDIRMLRKNSRGVFTKAMAALNSYLEIKDAGPFILQQEARAHKKEGTASSEPPAVPNVASLSGACDEFLGKPLLKFEQMSNWDHRPLRKAQVQYASLDAHATLALLDATLARAGVPLTARLGIAEAYLSPAAAAAADITTTASTSPVPVNNVTPHVKKSAASFGGGRRVHSPRSQPPFRPSSSDVPKSSNELKITDKVV